MRLLRSFATVGSATLASRVLGFVREVMIASLFGTGAVADAFYAAFSVPNLFRRFLAEGAFNSAFVPLFAKSLEKDGQAGAKRFASDVFAALVAVLLILIALLQIFMPAFIDLVVPGFGNDPDKRSLTIEMARVMMPYLFCLSLVAMLSGILNALHHYFLAAFAPVLLNVILIAVLTLSAVVGSGGTPAGGVALSYGVLAAGIAQLLVLIVGVRRQGFVFKLHLPRLNDDVKRLLILAAPAALAAGIVQINLFIGRIIASAEPGAITVLNLADRIYQLPLGVVGIAIGVVLLPELSRALKANNASLASETQNRSLEFALLLTLPAAVALFLIPAELIRTIYEHGAFTAEDTKVTAAVLAAFGIGLPSFVLIKVFSPGFFARENTKTPMIFAGIGAVVNIISSLTLFPIYGEVGIAAATSIAGWINATLLFAVLVRNGDWSFDAGFRRRMPLIVIATGVMGIALYGGGQLLAPWMHASSTAFAHIAGLTVLVVGGAVTYFGVVFAIGGVDRNALKRALKKSE